MEIKLARMACAVTASELLTDARGRQPSIHAFPDWTPTIEPSVMRTFKASDGILLITPFKSGLRIQGKRAGNAP